MLCQNIPVCIACVCDFILLVWLCLCMRYVDGGCYRPASGSIIIC